jgi:hypothetical protein
MSSIALTKLNLKSAVIDILALAFVYFLPSMVHLFPSVNLWYAEPMRLMLILSLVHARKENSYILALTLPIFSLLVSSHPSFPKSLLIITDLILNTYLFFYLSKKFGNVLIGIAGSILISKIVYYGLKYILISSAVITPPLITTPLYFQVITTVLFSAYLWLFLRKQKLS